MAPPSLDRPCVSLAGRSRFKCRLTTEQSSPKEGILSPSSSASIDRLQLKGKGSSLDNARQSGGGGERGDLSFRTFLNRSAIQLWSNNSPFAVAIEEVREGEKLQ